MARQVVRLTDRKIKTTLSTDKELTLSDGVIYSCEFIPTVLCQSIEDKNKLLILWQLHIMTKPREAARTRGGYIDLTSSVWSIPAVEMK